MKQLLAAYWTAVHGPVYAYRTGDAVHACCVTWRNDYVVVHHDDLLRLPTIGGKPDVSVTGVMEVIDLEDAVGECISPHVKNGQPARSPIRKSSIGEAIISPRLFQASVYGVDEEIPRSLRRPTRRIDA